MTPGRCLLPIGVLFMAAAAHAAPHRQTFTANAPPPALTRLSQWASGGEFEIAETLTGTNFVKGATSVQVTGITAVTEVVTSTTIRATFRIGRDVKPGTYLVTVTTAGGASAQPFIVQSNA